MKRDPLLLLAVNRVPCLRCNEKRLVLERVAAVEDFMKFRGADAAALAGRRLRNTVWNASDLLREAEKVLGDLGALKMGLLSVLDGAYPPQLREIYDPPFLLFYRGSLPVWEDPLLGIVGTRTPTGAGRKAAYAAAFEAAERGLCVVSGLARGIDGEAHRGSIDGGGRTLAVLGHGADMVHPKAHKGLAERILLAGGALFTEYEPGIGPLTYHFPERNRIISGLSRGVLVVEAPAKSGALITASFALDQGRDLFVHKGCLGGLNGEGAKRLAEEGAAEVETITDILEDWYSVKKREYSRPASAVSLGKCRQSDMSLARLLEEELRGGLVKHQGDYFRRINHG